MAPQFAPWKTRLAEFRYEASAPFSSLLVPTVDTARVSFLLKLGIEHGTPMLLCGGSGEAAGRGARSAADSGEKDPQRPKVVPDLQ